MLDWAFWVDGGLTSNAQEHLPSSGDGSVLALQNTVCFVIGAGMCWPNLVCMTWPG